MPLTRSDMPRLLEDGLKTVFFEALDAAAGDYSRIATVIGSESDQEVYSWLGAVPAIRSSPMSECRSGCLSTIIQFIIRPESSIA